MAWTNIANANLDVGAPIRSVDILALRDNVSAVPNGDTGAPRIRAEALNGGQSGNAPIFAARAWVNFDGTGTFSPNPSTSKIRASGNVSSITKNSTGSYTVNFSTAMPNSNYAAGHILNYGGQVTTMKVTSQSTSSSTFFVGRGDSPQAAVDVDVVQLTFIC
jgi:hypothetical protein